MTIKDQRPSEEMTNKDIFDRKNMGVRQKILEQKNGPRTSENINNVAESRVIEKTNNDDRPRASDKELQKVRKNLTRRDFTTLSNHHLRKIQIKSQQQEISPKQQFLENLEQARKI